MSTRGNPFEEMERLFERMGSQFREASQRWDSGDALSPWTAGMESMPVDVVERDDSYVVTVDLPGYERDDVEVEVTDHRLRIEAERERSVEEEDEQYVRQERRHEATKRMISLPEEIDKEGVSAKMSKGVLTITLPRLEIEDSQEIEIE